MIETRPAVVRTALATVLLVGASLSASAQSADPAADTLLASVRQVLGSEKLDKVSTLLASGTYRRLVGEREMSGDLELAIALPDKFLRTETIAPDPTNPVRRFSGFNGDTSLDAVTGGGGMMTVHMARPDGPGGPELTEEDTHARRMQMARRDFARQLLTLLVRAQSAVPLEYRYAGEAESDDGKADVLDVTGPDRFAAKVFLDKDTHVPLMITYKDAMPRLQEFRGGPSERRSREGMEERAKEAREAGPPPQVDVQVLLSDHKKVDGVLLPHTFRRAMDGKTIEEWEITSYRVNPAFKADKFEKK